MWFVLYRPLTLTFGRWMADTCEQHDAQLDYYGKRLATCSSDRTIKVYDVTGDVQNNEQILTGCGSPSCSLQALARI